MKISEMTNDQAAEAMIRLAEPIGHLCDDEGATALIDEYKKTIKGPMYTIIGRLLPRLIGYLMKEHRRDIYEIVSILSGKNLSEIGGLKLTETVEIIRESYDDVVMTFFPSSGIATPVAGKKLFVKS